MQKQHLFWNGVNIDDIQLLNYYTCKFNLEKIMGLGSSTFFYNAFDLFD